MKPFGHLPQKANRSDDLDSAGSAIIYFYQSGKLTGHRAWAFHSAGFGPEISATLSAFESTTGIGFDKVDHLVLSWLEDEQGQGRHQALSSTSLKPSIVQPRSGLLGDPDSEETEHGMIFR